MLSSAAGGLSACVPYLAHCVAGNGTSTAHVLGVTDPTDPGAANTWGPTVHTHSAVGPRAFGYAPGIYETLSRLSPDLIDVQGIWNNPSLVNLRYHKAHLTPYVVTPHGMLDPWARQRSYWKKRIVRTWFEDAHLRGATCLRATAVMEAEHFRSFGLRNPIAIVPNGVELPKQLAPRPSDRRRMLFLSRIHPKKGIDLLLRAWGTLEGEYSEWDLVIAGPDEVGHEAEMQAIAQRLGLKRVQWLPAVHGAEKSDLYRSADCFVLPTHAENFGLVVAEALAHEVPVITTKNAPWQGLKENTCGWWIDLNEQTLRKTLDEAMKLPREDLWSMGGRGRLWMARDFGWDRIAAQMAEVYEWCLGKAVRPGCVEMS